MDTLEERLAQLEGRLGTVEDELAILRTIICYGPAVDTGDAAATAEGFTEDCVYDVGGGVIFRGRDEIERRVVLGPEHQALLPNCAHIIGPVVTRVDGDRAVVTGYSRIYHRRDSNIELIRLGINRWEMRKQRGQWRVERRLSRPLGDPEAQDLLRSGVIPVNR